MKINNRLAQLFEQAQLVYKKPIQVKITGPILEQQVIASLENTEQIAQKGDYIVTGIKGEQYPIGPAIFAEYEALPGEPHMYCKKKKIIRAYQVDFEGEVETAQGSTLYFKPGYYIVMQSPTDAWAVEKDIFEQTYTFVK